MCDTINVKNKLNWSEHMSKTALVTGGSHNIGQGIAVVLAEKGYDVAITYNSRLEGALETKAEIEKLGRRCYVYQASLEIPEVPEKIVNMAHRDLGHIDLMVCNAGRDSRASILTATEKDLAYIYEANYRNYILCCSAAARHMVKDEIAGSIIFITSTRGESAHPDDFIYGSFKAAIKRACESIALELSAYNIRVNCVAPGCTWAPSPNWDFNNTPFVKESIPLHRSGTAREVGEAVAYLADDVAGYITGITLRIDGGLVLPGLLEGHDAIPWVRKGFLDKNRNEAIEMVNESIKKLESEDN